MTTAPKAHGLDGSLVEPDWPPLTRDELRLLFQHYPALGEPVEILSVSPRPFSAASVVATSIGRVFVKRHARIVRDVEGLLEEHRFLQHLHTRNFPVPRVFSAASGQTAISLTDSTYEIHEIPPGIDLYEEAISWTPFQCAAHAHAAGQILARLHQAAQSFTEPPRKPRLLVAGFTIFSASDPEAAMDRYLAKHPSLAGDQTTRAACQEALHLLAPFHAELQPHIAALPSLWTHNDLHASNLFWSAVGPSAYPTAVIDFGLADRTTPIHDIAHVIERNIVEWLVLVNNLADRSIPIHFDHLQALLSGYESVRPLFPDEAAALIPITALCHAEFALTEADYFLTALHSPEKARIATEDYLVARARWFFTPAGQSLLNALRHWAKSRQPQELNRP